MTAIFSPHSVGLSCRAERPTQRSPTIPAVNIFCPPINVTTPTWQGGKGARKKVAWRVAAPSSALKYGVQSPEGRHGPTRDRPGAAPSRKASSPMSQRKPPGQENLLTVPTPFKNKQLLDFSYVTQLSLRPTVQPDQGQLYSE